jgi:hypothetical protein
MQSDRDQMELVREIEDGTVRNLEGGHIAVFGQGVEVYEDGGLAVPLPERVPSDPWSGDTAVDLLNAYAQRCRPQEQRAVAPTPVLPSLSQNVYVLGTALRVQ